MFERLLDTPLNLRNLINTAFVLSNFEKTNTKDFPCGLLLSCSRILFNKERNGTSRDLAN